MNNSPKLQKAITLLEKLTGKKVLLEFTDEETPLSNRQKGAQQALATKGYDDWTIEQYAVAYWLTIYDKKTLPDPFNRMSMKEIAEDAGVKYNTLGIAIQRIKYLTSGEGYMSTSGPKIEGYINKFADLPKEKMLDLVMKAFDATPAHKLIGTGINRKAFKNSQLQTKAATPKAPKVERNKPVSTPELDAINVRRVAAGQPKLVIRGNNVVVESVRMSKYAAKLLESVNITDRNTEIVSKLLEKSKGNQLNLMQFATKVCENVSSPTELLSLYKASINEGADNVADVFYNSASKKLDLNALNEAKEILEGLTGKKVVLKEFLGFGGDPYKKLLSSLDKGIKTAENLRFYSAFYPEKWEGNEIERVKDALTSIFQTLTKGSKHLVSKTPVSEGVLTEWFAGGAFKKLMRVLKDCIGQAYEVNDYLSKKPGAFKVDPQLVLAKIKTIWKSFNKSTGVSGDNVSYAGDDVNKMSHKAPRTAQLKPQAPKPATKVINMTPDNTTAVENKVG